MGWFSTYLNLTDDQRRKIRSSKQIDRRAFSGRVRRGRMKYRRPSIIINPVRMKRR